MRRTVETEEAPKPVGPYAQAVLAGDFVFVAGQIGLDPHTGRLVGGGTREQLVQVLENVAAVLRGTGHTLDDVVKTTVYLVEIAEMPAVNEIYARYFPAPHPARATVQVAGLPAGARVEIEAIALRGRPEPA